jgi:hypothetical protein
MMLSFISYLTESIETEKLKHLEHAEDHHINVGGAGFDHAVETLKSVHSALSGKKSKAKITTKYDGSPSMVFGHHPENGKFFVASKSAFNVNPKLNYTDKDVEKNHGHSPGLVSKLKSSLEHLPKVAPKHGVYQGDLMYTHDDVKKEGGKFHFTPNTIKYSTPENSSHGSKIANAKLGVVVHTKYHGSTLENMKAKFDPDHKSFSEHSDVHLINPEAKVNPKNYTASQRKGFNEHIKAAEALHKGHNYDHLEGHRENLKTYINSTVKTGESPSVKGFHSHVETRHNKKIAELKTQKAKDAATQNKKQALDHINSNADSFSTTLKIHKRLQSAKDHLVNALSANPEFDHHVGDTKVKPEGFVANINNKPTKLVDRAEFSRANFMRSRG